MLEQLSLTPEWIAPASLPAGVFGSGMVLGPNWLETIMHLLPMALKAITPIADRKESGARWACTGIHVELRPDNGFLVSATDTKQLIIVEGKGDSADEYPESSAMQSSPNGEVTGIIPATVWGKVFGKAKSMVRANTKPILRNVAVRLGKGTASLSATDLKTTAFEQTDQVEGRFPPYKDIWPRQKPRVRFLVDGVMLGELSKAVAQTADRDCVGVYITLYDPSKPIIIEPVEQNDNYHTKALIMPLNDAEPNVFIRSESCVQFEPVRQMCADAVIYWHNNKPDDDGMSKYQAEKLMDYIRKIGEYAKAQCPLPSDAYETPKVVAGPEDNPADDHVPTEEEYEAVVNAPVEEEPELPKEMADDVEEETTSVVDDVDAAMSAFAFA